MENKTWKEFYASWSYVFWKGSTLIGAPILLCLLLVFLQKSFFTASCAVIGWQCTEGFGSAETIANHVAQSLSPNMARGKGEVIRYDFTDVDPESKDDAERLARVLEAEERNKRKR